MSLPSDMTLEQAKDVLRENWEEGVECPCCKQFVKLYRRKITSAMAYVLFLLSTQGDEYIHVENWLKEKKVPASFRGDFTKLRHWGLIETKSGIRDDGSKRIGYYKITAHGRDFVAGDVTVRPCVRIFNNELFGFEGEKINFKQALGDKFNYEELMGSKGQWL